MTSYYDGSYQKKTSNNSLTYEIRVMLAWGATLSLIGIVIFNTLSKIEGV